MSDKIKLIIEIPKEYYDDMKASNCWWSGLKKCVMNGILLDDVKAEIREQQKEYQEWGWAYDDVLEILDNIGKAESEDT